MASSRIVRPAASSMRPPGAAHVAVGRIPSLPDPQQFQAILQRLFASPELLEERVRKRFKQVAHQPAGYEYPVLTYEDMPGLVALLAQQLQVDPRIFGEYEQMYWRFDFSGDQFLDEDEATKLCLCMLRQYRDSTQAPQPGCIKLGGEIAVRNVNDRYSIGQKLGEGGQGAVYLSKDKHSGREVVVKFYDKSSPNAPVEDITAEFELMMKLQHPRIAHYFDIFQDYSNIYVVQEPYFGGDLTTAVYKATQAGVLVNEGWLARVFSQVFSGVSFLHTKDVMHCDLKEANVMVTGKTDWLDPQIVVIDFGLANAFNSKSHPGGTPGYMPPEVWELGLWTPKGDVFSLGVMMFSMRTGRSPFTENCRTMDDIISNTVSLKPKMKLGSAQVKALTMPMLEKSFHERPSVQRLLEFPWFVGRTDDEAVGDEVLANFAKRKEDTVLKRAMLADLAARQNLAEMKALNILFVSLDKNNDGTLTAAEVRQALRNRHGWTETGIENFIKALAGPGNEVVSYDEFMGRLIAAKAPEENEIIAGLFYEFDSEHKGYLDETNIVSLMKRPAVARVMGGREPLAVMQQMDKDGNGRVSYQEFQAALQGKKGNWSAGSGSLQSASVKVMRGIKVGSKLEYFSSTCNGWIPCVITKVDARAFAVQIDAKPGHWLQGNEMWKLRKPIGGGIGKCVSGKFASTMGKICGGICC